jgi:hypothetical protein
MSDGLIGNRHTGIHLACQWRSRSGNNYIICPLDLKLGSLAKTAFYYAFFRVTGSKELILIFRFRLEAHSNESSPFTISEWKRLQYQSIIWQGLLGINILNTSRWHQS